MELNIFKEAKLSPSETDKKKIIDGLNKRIKNLVGQRNQKIISKEECDEMQSYLKALIDEIESNPGIIAKHAKQYLDSFRKEIMDFASILIDGETKEITQEALDAVVKKFKSKGFTDKDLLDILGVKVPSMLIPVMPGRNLAVILETAAINNRQKEMGYNAAKELLTQLGLADDITK